MMVYVYLYVQCEWNYESCSRDCCWKDYRILAWNCPYLVEKGGTHMVWDMLIYIFYLETLCYFYYNKKLRKLRKKWYLIHIRRLSGTGIIDNFVKFWTKNHGFGPKWPNLRPFYTILHNVTKWSCHKAIFNGKRIYFLF